MQPSEDNKPGVGTSPNLKSRKTKWKRNKTGPSQTTAALLRSASDAGSADEDDDASSAAEVSQHRCIRAFRNALKSFMPGWTPVFMYCTLVLAILLIAFSHASEGNAPDFKFYGIYLAVSGALLALPLFLRVIWIFFFGKGLFVFTGRIYASLAAVLDPEITYLISTITIAIFWANAFTLVGETSGPMVTYRFLNNPSWTMSAGVADRDSMTNVEVLLIIWASRVRTKNYRFRGLSHLTYIMDVSLMKICLSTAYPDYSTKGPFQHSLFQFSVLSSRAVFSSSECRRQCRDVLLSRWISDEC